MVAIRYSSGVFIAKRTYARPWARSRSIVDGLVLGDLLHDLVETLEVSGAHRVQ